MQVRILSSMYICSYVGKDREVRLSELNSVEVRILSSMYICSYVGKDREVRRLINIYHTGRVVY